jgi:ribosomal protein L18
MADKNKVKAVRFERRKFRISNAVFGTSERPRLSVFRSDKHIYAQVIDDMAGKTLAAVATTSAEVRGADLKNGGNIAASNKVIVTGADKQAVGEFAARVRKVRKPEPYKGKGIRYEGEQVKIKPGKAFAGAGAK